MSDTQVLIYTFGDGYAAEMFVELLRSEGISAAATGLQHRGMLGIAGSYIQVPVRVAGVNAEAAQELLTLFQSSSSVESPYRGLSKAEEKEEIPRLKRIALMAAFSVPVGGGHFYARAYPAAWTMSALSLVGLISLSTDIGWLHALPLGVVLADLLLGHGAVERANEKRPWSFSKQILMVVVATALTTSALGAIGTQLDALAAIGTQLDIDSTNEIVDPYY